jgi:hypothetical protein
LFSHYNYIYFYKDNFLFCFWLIHIFLKQTKNNKRKRNTYLDTRGMPSLPSWLMSWLLNEVTGRGGAGIEPPNFNFVVAVVAGA